MFASRALYYKDITIINYYSSIVDKFGASVIDNITVVIYNHHMFIVQATVSFRNLDPLLKKFLSRSLRAFVIS